MAAYPMEQGKAAGASTRPPAIEVSERWAFTRMELDEARADLARARERLEKAQVQEQEAWQAMEAVAERLQPVPCAPPMDLPYRARG